LHAAVVESGVEISYKSLPRVLGNRSQLVQLFQNLVGNSIKFRSKVQPRISIHSERHESEWNFSIRDNGIGFDLKFADAIFVPFKRLHTKDEYPGTGIGLATCKKIIERHGGQIWAEATVGGGSVFHFSLKAAPTDS
jgi:chemotaxis family two-component system sensor kinase Cph1